MTIWILDCAILFVNNQFRLLVFAHFPTKINGVLFFVKMLDGSLTTTFLYIPATIFVGNHMMRFSWHGISPLVEHNAILKRRAG